MTIIASVEKWQSSLQSSMSCSMVDVHFDECSRQVFVKWCIIVSCKTLCKYTRHFCSVLVSQHCTCGCVPSQGKHHPVNVFEVSPAGSVSDQEAAATAAAAIGFGTGPLSRVPSDDQLQGGESGAMHDALDAAPTQGVPLTVMPAQLKPIIGRQVCTAAWRQPALMVQMPFDPSNLLVIKIITR